ncbi:ribbon-helix-helix protein, CopG family [Roseovarius gahaiensis]|uniref:Ribbon-helix-helix protein, CopG family n=1 Tax=Roseovarius gahaiensis TaxID=2716691 RepID=A0A967BCV6_9RHOB|nr:ribbon-helix-helix protein, CopG family [Roseovarius gahaiensis]NHQ75682.1 ribbon-helix-helix protein, CopG family [Roseovarius gahaiensis]
MTQFGRPKTNTKAVTLRLSNEMLEALDSERRNQKDIPTRPEMIRRILADWLEQKSQAEK